MLRGSIFGIEFWILGTFIDRLSKNSAYGEFWPRNSFYWHKKNTTKISKNDLETLILVIFDLIFAMKPPKFLKNLKISLKKKKKLWNLGWFQWNPSNGFKGFKKTSFFQKYTSKSRKNSTNVVEFYRDILVYFSKKGVFLKP